MALTDDQRLTVRRWLGYPALVADQVDYVIGSAGPSAFTLADRLSGLSAFEEATVSNMLTKIAEIDTALLAAAENLDTSEAGPWVANPREVAQRTALRDRRRRELADFLGFEPGPALGAGGGLQIVRC